VLLAAPWLLRASDLPPRLLTPAVLLAWGIGLAELAWRQRRPRVQVLLPVPPEPLQVAGQDVDAPQLVVRGPWLLLLWRQDRRSWLGSDLRWCSLNPQKRIRGDLLRQRKRYRSSHCQRGFFFPRRKLIENDPISLFPSG